MQLTREVGAPSAEAVDALDEAVVGLVHAITHAARHPAHVPLPDLELARLLAQGERRLGELAVQRGVCQSVVSRQVGELEARGLVVRRPDPADGRAGLVRLTPAGQELLEASARTRQRWLHGALARHPVEEVQAAVRVVRALADELDRRSPFTARAAEGQS
jgi:DNA-binding MarR family transcriptional regulator